MKKLYVMSCILIVLVLLMTGCNRNSKSSAVPTAQDGVVNLQNWDLDHDGMIKLNGEWEFYWKQLLHPTDFKENGTRGSVEFLKVPSFWNDNKELQTGKGYATYRVVLQLHGRDNGKLLSLYMPFGVESAYKVWINGEVAASAGRVGKSKTDMVAKYLPQVVTFPAKEKTEIIIQVSNYIQRTGGLWGEVRLGYTGDVTSFWNKRLAEELFVAGSIIIMGIYHLGLYLNRRKDKSPLYFGGFCLLIGVRSLFLGEVFINHRFPDLNFEVYKKIEYLGQYIGPALFILYVQSLFPKEIHKRVVQFSTVFYLIVGAVVLLTPSSIFTYTLLATHVVLLVLAPYIVYVFVIAAVRRREGALFCCILFLIMALTVVNDILHYNSIITTFDMAKFGLFIFIFAQAFLLSTKFSKAFQSVEELSNKQAKWSQELELTVDERTTELKKTLEDLKDAQRQLVESEKMAALGALVAGIAHEINTPVGVSVTAASHLKQKTDEIMLVLQENKMKKSDLINYFHLSNESTHIISNNLNRASELIKGFKLVAVDQSHEDKRYFYVKDYIQEVLVSLKPQLRKTKHQLVFECPDDLEIYSYPGAFSQILTNLIMNSIIHAFGGEEQGVLSIHITKISSQLRLEYRDNGKGMPPEVKEKIFDPFFTTNRGGGGTGLGMHVIYNLVTQSLAGTIHCESELGQGTLFIIHLPLEERIHDA